MEFAIKIPYVEIRDRNTRKILGIIEGAEVFFYEALRGVGDFEIYCRSTPNSRKLLVKDNLVTLPSTVENEEDNVWIIENIEKTNDSAGARFITATGREAKILLNRRIIRYTTVLKKSESLVGAIRDKLINPNAINPKTANRKLDGLIFGASDVVIPIQEETQVTWDNLFDYTETLLMQYDCAAKLRIDKKAGTLIYTIYKGEDKSGKVLFSQANENLLSSEYVADYTNYKTSVIVGGEEETETDASGNEVKTGVRTIVEIPSTETGYDRREVFIDANDLQSEYEDENGEKQTMSPTEYQAALMQRGREKKVEEHSANVAFQGVIDTTSKRYKFGKDYGLGDLITIRDEDEKKSVIVKVLKRTRVQNNEGYAEEFESEDIENVE